MAEEVYEGAIGIDLGNIKLAFPRLASEANISQGRRIPALPNMKAMVLKSVSISITNKD